MVGEGLVSSCVPGISPLAHGARDDEGVAPPTNEKSNPIGLLRSLARVDRKDAN